eukprot:TRINITY_DN4338_c0_g1_i3.p1 TRINITY_DN4338_c0_g1~~TRINITY_DN4338_c0_g1_i3.p1  ORF type:complete len:699 (-),score=191.79 TRINITY_DN4338_c0_g1_i3:86-2182(-)
MNPAWMRTEPVRKSKSRPSSSRGGDVIPETASMDVLPPDPFDAPPLSSRSSDSSRPNSSTHRRRDVTSADSKYTMSSALDGPSTFLTSRFEEENDRREEEAERRAAAEEALRIAAEDAWKAAQKEAARKKSELESARKAAEAEAARLAKEARLAAEEEEARKAAEVEAAKARAEEEAARRVLEEQLANAELEAKEAEEEERRTREARNAASLEVKRYEMAKQQAQEEIQAHQAEIEARKQKKAEDKWREEVAAAAAAAEAAEELGVPLEDKEPIRWSEDLREYVGTPMTEHDEEEEVAKSYEEIAVGVDAFLAMQESMREHLVQYCQMLEAQRDDEGNKLVEFPDNFDDVIQVMQDEARQRPGGLMCSKWAKYLVEDEEVVKGKGKELERQKKMIAGMRAIQKLDLTLAEKTKEDREMKKKRQTLEDPEGMDGSSERERQLALVEDTVKKELQSKNWVGQRHYKLSEQEEERVERLLQTELSEMEAATDPVGDGKVVNGYALGDEETARLEHIEKALAAMDGTITPEVPATYFDGSEVIPKAGDATFLQFEREKREERLAAAKIEQDLFRLQAAAGWPRPEDLDREAVSQILAHCDPEDQKCTEQEKARVAALVQELRVEGNRGVTPATPASVPRISVETKRPESARTPVGRQREHAETNPRASPGGSPTDTSRLRTVTVSRRNLIRINPVLAAQANP